MKKVVFVLLLLILISCGSANKLPQTGPSVRDSTRVVTKIETIYIKDTVLVALPHQEKENTTEESHSHLETDFAESDASIDSSGRLHHTLNNKKGNVPVPTETPMIKKDSIVFRDKEIEVPKPYPVEVEVPRDLTWWQQTQMIGFWIALSLFMLKYRKSVFGFIRRFI